MADVSADDFLSATKCVLERFHIDKFRETHQDAILNFLKRKRCFSLTANRLRKMCNFHFLNYPKCFHIYHVLDTRFKFLQSN